jgi:hypothetical protein
MWKEWAMACLYRPDHLAWLYMPVGHYLRKSDQFQSPYRHFNGRADDVREESRDKDEQRPSLAVYER